MPGLQLKVSAIILGSIFSTLLSDLRTEKYSYTSSDGIDGIFQFRCRDKYPSNVIIVVFYFSFVMIVSCMHAMSILCSAANNVSSSSWPVLIKVLT